MAAAVDTAASLLSTHVTLQAVLYMQCTAAVLTADLATSMSGGW